MERIVFRKYDDRIVGRQLGDAEHEAHERHVRQNHIQGHRGHYVRNGAERRPERHAIHRDDGRDRRPGGADDLHGLRRGHKEEPYMESVVDYLLPQDLALLL